MMKPPKQPDFRIENGRKIYSVKAIVDCSKLPGTAARKIPPHPPLQKGGQPVAANEAGAQAPGDQAASPAANEVRARFRLLSAVDAWPSMGWLGPQLVRYGHNDAAALRQVSDLINNREKPVPLMWNHSYDIHDKAGKVENAEWEDSTDIPPGVNGDLVVNRDYDQKAAIGLETGELDATSICVQFEMEQSHPDMDWQTFWGLAGDPGHLNEVNGQIAGWLPISAVEVLHHALVWAGADPNSGPRNKNGGQESQPHNGEDTTAPAAGTVQNATGQGGDGIMDKLIALVSAVLGILGIEVVIGNKGEVPDNLPERVVNKLNDLVGLRDLYNGLTDGLAKLVPDILANGESSLTSAQVMERLPGIVQMAKNGALWIQDLRADALKQFDGAKFEPGKELSNEAKQIRAVIEACSDPTQLKAYIAEYRKQKEERLGKRPDLRVSLGEEVPHHGGDTATADEKRIAADMNRWRGEEK